MGALPQGVATVTKTNTRDDCDWPEKHDISRMSLLFAVSGIDQSRDNLDNLLPQPPPGIMGNLVSFCLFFFLLLIFKKLF